MPIDSIQGIDLFNSSDSVMGEYNITAHRHFMDTVDGIYVGK